MIYELPYVVTSYRVREWCKLPYINHPHGCPNYGNRDICPPDSPLFEDIVKAPYYLIVIRYDLKSHIERMKNKHPNWSERQLRCCLYWQNTAKKMLKSKINRFVKSLDFNYIILDGINSPSPEATGVNLFTTANLVGIKLKTYPKDYVYKMAIIGKRK